MPATCGWDSIRSRFPERLIIIGGDDDRHSAGETLPDGRPKPNVGREKAEEAAAAIGGQAIFPVFSADDKGTDWNDLAQPKGRERARAQVRWHCGPLKGSRTSAG